MLVQDSKLTLVERSTRYIVISKIKSKTSISMLVKMYNLIKEKNLPIKSITVDNGLEFEKIRITAKQFNFKVYYYQTYCSFQRGSNENVNGLIRRRFPKGIDFSLVSEEKIKNVEWLINNRLRKIFNFKSNKEIYSKHI